MASASFVTSSRGASHAATPEDGSSPMISRATSPSGFDGKKKANGLPLLHLSIEQDGSATPQLALSPLSASVAKDAGPTLSSPVASGPAEKVEAMRSKRHTLSVPALRLPRSASFVSVVNKSKGDRQIPSSPIEGVSDAEDAVLTDVSRPESPMPGPVARHVNGGSPLPSDQEGMPPGSVPDSYFHQRPTNQPHPPGQHRPRPVHKLALHIPGLSGAHHVSVQADGTPLSLGAYELVAKERCYMMYLAIYVWRGCLDRVKGTSHGTVKSGLLAGRVGNKGAVGISMKLGHTRLLFVNAHLAAHDFRVAERIANVHKIKKELKVDTFLPPEDERNKDDDLTACFDHAFWFGDLNFRVDIDRRHADWLLMNKEYDKALKFDQLKRIMAESQTSFAASKRLPFTFLLRSSTTCSRQSRSRKRRS
ncbi:hypothetical protein L7F22_042866 [Adiantum nelumboides]|nr:hypothetical protein [Adiantum nelumboides]